MDKHWHWWRVQLRDTLELFLLPGLAAILPWPLCFWVFKKIAKSSRIYSQVTESGWIEAKKCMLDLCERQWKWERRLITLIDHADLFLSCTRSEQWIEQQVRVFGAWPTTRQSNVICTFHWGAGMFSLHAMRHAGLQVHALAASLDITDFVGRPVLHRYAKWRTQRVRHLLGLPVIDVKNSMRPVIKAIQNQYSLLAVLDVPSDHNEVSVPVTLLGQKINVPRGLLRLAVDRQLYVTVFLLGINLQSGQRELKIHSLGLAENLQQLYDSVFNHLDSSMSTTPSAWHLWAEMPRFLK